MDGIYYFSYSYCTTKKGTLLSGEVPDSGTLAILIPFATAMGNYTGTTADGIVIDDTWKPNDGLVSVVSAQYPNGETFETYTADTKPKTGVWYVMETRRGHHGTVIGLQADADETHQFYNDLFTMIEGLKR